MRLPKDEYGNLLVNEEDAERFCVAIPGDHLFCQFQCELCHFRNIQRRSPMYGMGVLDDSELTRCLQRVSLETFSSRKLTTISQNLSKINRALQIAYESGLKTPPAPELGRWRLED
jgi:hypothetical protein